MAVSGVQVSSTASRRAQVAPATTEAAAGRARITSLDAIRGAVMVLMAVDHVRVYAGVPAFGTAPSVFFTRWITHFCAPAFFFLAGTSAFLHGRKLADTSALTRFLLVRGAWLVVLELTFLRLAWTFNFDYQSYVLAGVIWALGWCMILLGGLVKLPMRAIAIVGGVIVAGHNLLDSFVPQMIEAAHASPVRLLWELVYLGPISIDGTGGPMVVLYSIVPWIGVMALGYAFGTIVVGSAEDRRRFCLRVGLGAIAAFVLLRATRIYGDPNVWDGGSVLGFLNTTKYPASLQFLLMTLGPTIALVPLLEHAHGWVVRQLTVFGRVPLFYYLLHIPLIHIAACLVSLAREGRVNPWLFANFPSMPGRPPDGYMWSLPLLYAVFAAVVITLYFPCRWYGEVKARRRDPWLQLI